MLFSDSCSVVRLIIHHISSLVPHYYNTIIKYNFHTFTIMINALKIQKCKNSCTNVWHLLHTKYIP